MSRHDDDMSSGLLVEEAELRAMFAARRPDPGAFATGVAERLADATTAERDDGSGDGDTTAPRGQDEPRRFGVRPLLDRAAGVLGVPTFGSSGKSLLSIVSLPFLLLVGVIVTFVHSFRRVDPDQHRDRPAPSARSRTAHRTFQMLLPSIGSLLGIVAITVYFLSGGGAIVELVTLVLLVGMVVMAWHIGQTARGGVVSSLQIARGVILMLLAAVFGCWAWLGSIVVFDGDSMFGHRAVGWVLWSGAAAACILTAWQSRNPDGALSMILVFVLPLLGVASLELPSNTSSRVRESLAGLSLHPEHLSNWGAARELGHALDAAGLPPLAMPDVAQRVADALSAAVALPPQPWTAEVRERIQNENQRVHPQVWSTAIGLGLVGQEQLHKLATVGFVPARLENLIAEQGELRLRDYDFYLLECLLATRDLGVADREHLAQRLAASWPRPDQPVDALEQALACARWLDRLGRRDLVLAHRAALHELLQQHWVSVDQAAAFTRPGGFCSYPEKNRHSNIAATANAVALIQFVGAPAEVPLHHVSAYLRNQYRTSLLGRMMAGRIAQPRRAEAARLLLHEGIGLPERGWFAVLVGERALLAALLLVLLGLRAIRVAHCSERSLLGAMP